MAEEPIEYDGALVRSLCTPTSTTLRFFDLFQPILDADKPVLVITLEAPSFASDDIPDFMSEGEDVRLIITPQRIDVAELYGGRTAVLMGKRVSAANEAYDAEDLKMFLRRADELGQRDWHDLKQSRETINTGINLIIELLRRAEIKASSSEAQDEKQAAAIAVLNRLLAHFQEKK